jgi:glycerophosphoryl diester phosphodiesterase
MDEVLERFKNRIKFMIELKSKNIGEPILKSITKYDIIDDCIISGRNLSDLKRIKRRIPKICVCYNITKGRGLSLKDFLKRGGENLLSFKPDLISLHSNQISKDFIDICHNNQIIALSWAFLEYEEPFEVIKDLIKKGIDGILFDNYKNVKLTKIWLEKLNQTS